MEVESGETAARDEATINEAAKDDEESGQLVTKRNTSAPVWKHLKQTKVESRGTFAALSAVFVIKKSARKTVTPATFTVT